MEAGRARDVDRARVQPGPRGDDRGARAAERDRGRVRRASTRATSATATRASCTRSTSSSRSRGPGGIARRDLAPQRAAQHRLRPTGGWERAVEMMAAAREEGMDVLADTTPFVDGLGQLSGDPAAVGAQPTAREAASRACATPRHAGGCARECDRYWRFIHKGEWDRVRLQASEQHPGAGTASRSPEIADLRKADPVGLLLRRPRRRGHGVRERPRRRPALHRRAHGGDDLAPALLPRRRHLHRARRTARSPTSCATRSAYSGHVHYLTHHVRENGTLRARGGDPQDDEHARGALRPLGPRPAARAATRPTSSSSTTTALDDVSTIERPARLRARRRARARQRRRRRRRRRAHGRAARAAPAAGLSR